MMEELKKELKNTLPLFRKFFDFTQIQKEAIPKILSGKNLLLISPAASGKTEAVIIPLIERLKRENWCPLSILYVTPTRALVNDLFRRLREPLSAIGVKIARKTLDHNEFKPEQPQDLLITTPESFDSLLTRSPQSLLNLKAVCLDELHLIDNTYRGDQLRVLLKRLKLLCKRELSFYAMSATIPDPENLGKRYIEDFEVIQIKGVKPLSYWLYHEDDLKTMSEIMRMSGYKKLIAFCNTRHHTEEFSRKLRFYFSDYKVFTHHASLSKKVREYVESLLHSQYPVICVATMTLELGIDVGDVDAIILYTPPPTCSSLLQRLGRGNRKENKFIAYGVYRNEWEENVFKVLFELVKRGYLENPPYSPCISVAVQQILSYVCQKKNRGATIRSIEKILEPLSLSKLEIGEIIDILEDNDFIFEHRGVWLPTEKLERRHERGFIHSNIEALFKPYDIVDKKTGRTLGVLEMLSPFFVLGGKLWSVEKISDNQKKIYVSEIEGIPFSGKVFKGKGCPLWDFSVGKELKRTFFGDIGDYTLPYFVESGKTYIFHFMGLTYGVVWADILAHKKEWNTADVEGVCLTIAESVNLKEIFDITEQDVELSLTRCEKWLRKYLGLGAYYKYLPSGLKKEAMMQRFSIDSFLKLIKSFELKFDNNCYWVKKMLFEKD